LGTRSHDGDESGQGTNEDVVGSFPCRESPPAARQFAQADKEVGRRETGCEPNHPTNGTSGSVSNGAGNQEDGDRYPGGKDASGLPLGGSVEEVHRRVRMNGEIECGVKDQGDNHAAHCEDNRVSMVSRPYQQSEEQGEREIDDAGGCYDPGSKSDYEHAGGGAAQPISSDKQQEYGAADRDYIVALTDQPPENR
jgi:hypothetical protein